MTAESIAKSLGGRKVGSGWMARCSAHNDREPRLSISAGDEGIDFYYAIETWQPRLDRDLSRENERLHRLGPRAVDELLLEIDSERHCLKAIEDKLARYAELDSGLASAVGGDRFSERMLMVVST